MRALVVEDNDTYRAILSRRLPQMSINGRLELAFAPNLESARRQARDCDLLIVDLSLPDSTPENTMAWALDMHRRTPVVVLTGTLSRDFVRLAKIKGLGFVLKTDNMEALEIEVIGAQAVAQRRQRRLEMYDELADALMGLS